MYNFKIFLSFFCLIYIPIYFFETLTFQKKVMEKTNIVITGASGLFGRALMTKFSKGSWKKVIGTAFSRYLFWIMHPTTYLALSKRESHYGHISYSSFTQFCLRFYKKILTFISFAYFLFFLHFIGVEKI